MYRAEVSSIKERFNMNSKTIYFKILHQFCCVFTLMAGLFIFSASSVADIDSIHPSVSDLAPLYIDEQVLSDDGELHLELTLHGKVYSMILTQNTALLKNPRSSKLTTESTLYKGYIDGLEGSWVRLSRVNDNYVGAFFDGFELVLIDQAQQAIPTAFGLAAMGNAKLMNSGSVAFNASSVHGVGQCANDPRQQQSELTSNQLLGNLDIVPVELGAITNREIKITIVVDTEYVALHGSQSVNDVLAQMNIVDGIFSEQLGLSMVVQDVVVLTSNGPMVSTNADELLVSFRNHVYAEMRNRSLTYLFTGKDLSGSVKGIAYLNSACGAYGVGVIQARSMSTLVAIAAAHEFGHSLGAPHDNQAGSACSATPGTFLMNPLLNGSDQFSACSLDIMQSVIANSRCVADVTPVVNTPPTITSQANVNASVNVAYEYDADNQLEADGSPDIRYELDFGPEGMAVDAQGMISWTPTLVQVGVNSVQISASNAFGSDTQNFDVVVQGPPDASVLNFNDYTLASYAGGQDANGTATVADGGATLVMLGNTWKKIDFAYTITEDTVLEFDFSSNARGEIHAIGLDTDLNLSANRTFNLYGSQRYGVNAFKYSGSGDVERFVIPVGDFYSGEVSNMFFAMDHDVNNPTGQSVFSNIRLYEAGQAPVVTPPSITSSPNLAATVDIAYEYDADSSLSASGTELITYSLVSGPSGMEVSPDGRVSWTPNASQEGVQPVVISATNSAGTDTQEFDIVVSAPVDLAFIDFNRMPPLSFGGRQDVGGTVGIEDGGATLFLEGNLWKRVDLEYRVTPNTVLRFEYKSTSQGEVHAIGLNNSLSLSHLRTFKLYGHDNYGVRDFTYTGNGEYQTFEIPVGQYYQGAMTNIFFAMDHDVRNPTGNSYFKNIQIVEN